MFSRTLRLGLGCLFVGSNLAYADAESIRFLPEDWIFSYETTNPNLWGVSWGLNNYMVPFRTLQRGKQYLESRYTNNWRFSSDHVRPGGVLMRLLVGTGLEFGAFMGSQNLHHQMGHDAAARELSRLWGLGPVPTRYGQVLPKYFPDGGELKQEERNTGGGADANTQYMVQPMQAELQFAYAEGKNILERDESNRDQVENFLIYRLRHMSDWFDEKGPMDQGFSDFLVTANPTQAQRQMYSSKPFSTDYTDYINTLNRIRYGVTSVGDYKVTMNDLGRSHAFQMLDPLFLVSAWHYGQDYVVRGNNQVKIPMLRLTEQLSYFPSFRIHFSPFGIDYFQDNYLRFHGALTNLYWTMGDNSYEKRYGGGVDIENITWRRVRLGLFGMIERQPLLSRITDRSTLPAGEIGQGHLACNGGGSIKFLLRRFQGDDQEGLFSYARAGAKNTSWFPGEYMTGGIYLQVGIGLRL